MEIVVFMRFQMVLGFGTDTRPHLQVTGYRKDSKKLLNETHTTYLSRLGKTSLVYLVMRLLRNRRAAIRNIKSGTLFGVCFDYSFLIMALGFLALAAPSQAQVSEIGKSIVPTNPQPGQAFQLSVTYSNNCTGGSYNAATSWLVAFGNDGTNFVGCPAAGQVFLVDNVGLNTFDSGTNGGQMGWTGPAYQLGVGTVANDATTGCVTFVHSWNLFVPPTAAYGGTYDLVFGGGNYSVQCGSVPQNGFEDYIPITIPVPPATIVSVQKTAEGGQAAPGDLVLYTVSYDFVNSPGGGTVTDVVPAGVTVIQMGPLAPVGTTMGTGAPGSTISWTVPGSGLETKGQVWFLARVANGATGTISNQATLKLASGSMPSLTSNIANTTVGGSGFQLIKSQNPANGQLTNGQTITYTLAYSINGFSLQWYDSYDNGTNGQKLGGLDMGGNPYIDIPSSGGPGDTDGSGGFVVNTDAQGNRYLVATSSYNANGGDYPVYLRNGGVTCFTPGSTYVVEGDMQIPTSSQGVSYGADADLVVAYSAQGGTTYAFLAGISIDNNPYGYIQMQANECPASCPMAGAGLKTYGGAGGAVTIMAGVWYTVRVIVTVSAVGTLSFQEIVWQRGNPSAVDTFTWGAPPAFPNLCGGGVTWQQGWESTATSSPAYYANLKFEQGDPITNATITDTNPLGNFGGENHTNTTATTLPTFSGSPTNLKWLFNGTNYNLQGAVTWWGTVTCAAASYVTYVNQAAITANGDAAVTSNAVTAILSCSTPTFTVTPTVTNTFTPTRTPTVTNTWTVTPTPTYTYTVTPTKTNTNTFTITPTQTPTNTPTVTFTKTPTATPTVTPTVTNTVTPTYTPTVTNTRTPTVTPTVTPTQTPTVSPTFTFTVTNTVTRTNTPTITNTVTPTVTPTRTNTYTPTVSPTNTFTVTNTVTPTVTNTVTNTRTPTVTPTVTVTPTPTNTFQFTPTITNTYTLTNTQTVTNTVTPTVSPTWTNTKTNTVTPTNTFTITFTCTPTVTPTITVTVTPTVSPTFTQTFQFTPTVTDTYTTTNTPTQTNTPTWTQTLQFTPTVTDTYTTTNTPTQTDTPTWTHTLQFTPTVTDTYTQTNTPTVTNTRTQTPTPTSTFTPSFTRTYSPTDTSTSTPTLTNTSTPTPSPTSTNTLTFTPTATPTGNITLSKQVSTASASSGSILVYTLTINVSGNSESNVVITDPLPAYTTFMSFGSVPSGAMTAYNQATSILSWQMPSPLGPGQYQLTYQASINNLLPGGLDIQNCAVLTSTAAGPLTACADTLTSGQYTIKIGVYNEAGELIQSLPVSQFSQAINSINLQSNTITALTGDGSNSVIYFDGVPIGTWNGLDLSGDPVTNGKYFVKVDSMSNLGVVTSVTQPVVVNRSLAKVTIKIYNEAGEVVRNLYGYMSNPDPNMATQVTLSVTAFEPTSGNPSGNIPTNLKIILNNGTTVVWNGQTDQGAVVTSGQYFVEVHAVNGQGGETEVTEKVTVLSDNAHQGMGNIVAEPNIVNPATGYSIQIKSDAPGLNLVYHVYNTAGELVHKPSPTDLTGPSTSTWDASGVASGLYFAVVDALNSQGGLVGRQNLKIVVIH